MTINKHINGDDIDADETNEDNSQSLSFNILNKIRQTLDRADVDSKGQDDMFTEAYVDANGQNNTVTVLSTDAAYDLTNNSYNPKLTATGSETSEAHGEAFNGTSGTTADKGMDITPSSNRVLTLVTKRSDCTATRALLKDDESGAIIETASFSTDDAVFNSTLFSGTRYRVTADDSGGAYTRATGSGVSLPQVGTKITWNSDSDNSTTQVQNILSLETKAGDTTDSIIEHAIPAGTYPATISKLIGKAMYDNWESGVNIQHRLENASENSGWIDDGVLGSFTAFTSEPTKYLVKIVIKVSAPTNDYPSIIGSGMYTE